MNPQHIAILGGGLTGLSSAFHLSRRFPTSIITLLEKQPRLGGWVRSERIQVGNGSVLIESGPRTLRPKAKSVLELINLLKLSDSIITVPSTAPAAQKRYLSLPGKEGLLTLPSSVLSVFTSPFRGILIPSVIREIFKKDNRPKGITDESIDSFLTRRFGEPFARILGSALIHGIYGADSRKLSIRSAALSDLWDLEDRGGGTVVGGFLSAKEMPEVGELKKARDFDLGDTQALMKGVSVYSFKDGMQTLTDAIERDLRQRPNVRIMTGTGVTSLQRQEDKSFVIKTTTNETLTPTHLVSALPLPFLHKILPPTTPLPHLTANSASSITIVNLIFPTSPTDPICPPGFGYLIPRPEGGYSESDPGILGTVFDSGALSSQDIDTNNGIRKLTMMMGGPYPITSAHTSLPTLLKHLQTHLARPTPLPAPLFHRVRRLEGCIPTLGVGHLDRMGELLGVLEGEEWDGRLEVAGAGVDGVSVGDCVEAGKYVGESWGKV